MGPALRAVALVFVMCVAPSARAEPWYEGRHGHNRVLHLSIAAGAGLLFVASETWLKPSLAPDSCRWCVPPSIDVDVRRALVWDDVDGARALSNLTGYVAVPVLGIGITALSAMTSEHPSWGQLIDDTIPVLETIAVTQTLTQIVKFAAGRSRPLVRFSDPPGAPDIDDNLSFFSGHSALVFSITTSAGMIAHWKRARSEPAIWAVGLTLSATTAYLRIAADRHYLTDVLTGSLVGVAAGLTIPRLMRRYTSFAIVPTGSGVSVAGRF